MGDVSGNRLACMGDASGTRVYVHAELHDLPQHTSAPAAGTRTRCWYKQTHTSRTRIHTHTYTYTHTHGKVHAEVYDDLPHSPPH